jgi:uncharacterized protein YdaU (DUF1376 family)
MSLAYFPMFPTDFDADTGHLTFAEDGAYNRLLRLSWRCLEAKMPDDLDWICRKARAVTPEDRALIEGILAEFFTRKGGKVFSRRLHEEWVKANDAHAKRISAGSKGGRAKSLKTNDTDVSNATSLLKQPEPEPEPLKKEREPIGSTKKIARGSRLPEDWKLPDEWRQETIAKGVNETLIRHQAERFKNFWLAKSGKDATKIDWRATWRNWMAKYVEEAELRKGPATAGADWWGGRDL